MLSRIPLFFTSFLLVCPEKVFASTDNATNSGYLEYKEPVLLGTTSVYSTFLYVVSLILVFAFVLLSAYFVSRFLGNKMGSYSKANTGKNIVGMIPFDQNKKIVFLQVNDSLLLLGVTENNISLLQEITRSEDIERIKKELFNEEKLGILDYQSKTLSSLQQKIKPMLRNLPDGKKGENDR